MAGLLGVLKSVPLAFLHEGMLVRGGLASERHFKSNSITYSHALALAPQVESPLAVYPRIVIDKNVVETQKTNNIWPAVARTHLVCERNGLHFLNVLDVTNWSQVYASAKAIYARDRDSLIGKENEFLKHVWFENYLFASPHAEADADHHRTCPASD